MVPSGADGTELAGGPGPEPRAQEEGPPPDGPAASTGGVGAVEDPGVLFPGEAADEEAADGCD
eukprot:11202990-Alexandrium_andersonii.AAC.1